MHWSQVFQVDVPAKPSGLWTLVAEYVRGPALIKVEAPADGLWNYSEASGCVADGDLLSLVSSQGCLLRGAPVGALIAKVGGSTAGTTDGTMFLAGRSCIYEVNKDTRGPLYLSINDEPTGMVNNSGRLRVTVSIGPIAVVPPQEPPAVPQN